MYGPSVNSTSSRETLGLSGKQNLLIPEGPYINCILLTTDFLYTAILQQHNKSCKARFFVVYID